VLGGHEAVLLRCGGDPFVEPALLYLDHAMAPLAEQVVVMFVAAEAVALLASVVRQDVHDTVLAQQRERSVDRGEAGARVALAQSAPKLLRCHVVALRRQLLEDVEASLRRADALPREQLRECLPSRGHWSTILAVMRMRTVIVLASLPLAGCGASSTPSGLKVVAAENVYGNIAAQIGGTDVAVTSILTDPNADPHLFEAGAANGLAVADAKVVLQNGLGYDAFMTKAEAAAPSKSRIVVTMADVLGVHGSDANPHLWYDVPRLDRIAAAIAAAFVRADPSNAVAYHGRLHRFERSLAPLRREVATIRERFHGAPVAYTEPVPGYLLSAAGLRNLAPSSFTRPIEEGTEPSPSGVAAMTTLVAKRRVRVLLYNSQAVSPITSRLRAAARKAGIPVVAVSETLPPHLSFQRWQLGQARALAAALAR
jgi:zinc/manganese transport system substrate-binding protein